MCAQEEEVRETIPFTEPYNLDLCPEESKVWSDKVHSDRAVPAYAGGCFWQL